MFCKYCGRKLQEGEVCSCRQQNGQAPGQPPLMQAPGQTAQKEEGSRSIPPVPAIQVMQPAAASLEQHNAGKKGLAYLSLGISILLLLIYILLRTVLRDPLTDSLLLEEIYPYLLYVIPVFLGIVALLLSVFSLQDKGIRTISIAGILVSVLFTAGTLGSLFVFPYEPYAIQASNEREEDPEEEDEEEEEEKEDMDEEQSGDGTDNDEQASDSLLSAIKADYKKKEMDYAEAKNALADLDAEELEGEAADDILEFQSTIEKDLEDKLAKLASDSDFKPLMEELAALKKAVDGDDEFLEELVEKYDAEYIFYLDSESEKLVKAGKKDEAVKLLEESESLVNDKNAVLDLLLEVQNTAGKDEYIIPDSNSRYLSDADLSGLNIQQINYAKNEIYARHGRRFQSAELQTYFNSKSWYNGTVDPAAFRESMLNDFEKRNVELLSKKEFSMESGGYKLDQ